MQDSATSYALSASKVFACTCPSEGSFFVLVATCGSLNAMAIF